MAVHIDADHKALDAYYARLSEAREGKDTRHEGNIRRAFGNLLEETAKAKKWKLVTEQTVRDGSTHIRYDGVLRDDYNLPHGHWEAKDSDDKLDTEIKRKRDKGYNFKNIIFEDTREAALYQFGQPVMRVKVDDRDGLAQLLTRFYTIEIAPFENFGQAITHFQAEIPHIANGLNARIKDAHKNNKKFQSAFADFLELCRTSLNPNIREEAVDEMLIQHLLTERLLRTVFNLENFARRNVIAYEIEKVIDALTSQHFNRTEFLGALDRFYKVIEDAAEEVQEFSEKQHFINTVYEKFFQGYSVKVADTHGIVYTPQEIVDFMCAAVEEVLQDEFDMKLTDPDVKILDPATGTGNFIVNLLKRAHERDPLNFDTFYKEQLFANEVMLLPYYVASLNIEHEYYTLAGKYEAFEGLAFVDTLDMAEGGQTKMAFISEKNSERVQRQKDANITIIIGNPPYNVGQLNENDNNRNRTYDVIDDRVRQTYIKDSTASREPNEIGRIKADMA